MKNDKNRASSTVLSFIKSAIRTQTLDEMAAALHFTPKRTRYLIDRYHLAKAISDSGWGMFINMLEYKAGWYGRELRKVDRFYPSSKTCSVCGYVNKALALKDREWLCPVCGTRHDRDLKPPLTYTK